jgi:hypothetical protein
MHRFRGELLCSGMGSNREMDIRMTRIMQFNATLLTAAFLYGAYHYGLLESVLALAVLCFAGGLFLKRVFG